MLFAKIVIKLLNVDLVVELDNALHIDLEGDDLYSHTLGNRGGKITGRVGKNYKFIHNSNTLSSAAGGSRIRRFLQFFIEMSAYLI